MPGGNHFGWPAYIHEHTDFIFFLNISSNFIPQKLAKVYSYL